MRSMNPFLQLVNIVCSMSGDSHARLESIDQHEFSQVRWTLSFKFKGADHRFVEVTSLAAMKEPDWHREVIANLLASAAGICARKRALTVKCRRTGLGAAALWADELTRSPAPQKAP